MTPLPTKDLRSNVATFAVPTPSSARRGQADDGTPATESFDADFEGQQLCTTYFDTDGFTLYKARFNKDKYLTLRVRHYRPE